MSSLYREMSKQQSDFDENKSTPTMTPTTAVDHQATTKNSIAENAIRDSGDKSTSAPSKTDEKRKQENGADYDDDANVKKAATTNGSLSKTKIISTASAPGSHRMAPPARLKDDGASKKSTLAMAPGVDTSVISSSSSMAASRKSNGSTATSSSLNPATSKQQPSSRSGASAKSQRLSYAPHRAPSLQPSTDDEQQQQQPQKKGDVEKEGEDSSAPFADDDVYAPGAFSVRRGADGSTLLQPNIAIGNIDDSNSPTEILQAELVDQAAIEEQIVDRKKEEIRTQIIQDAPKATKVEVAPPDDEEAEKPFCQKNKCCVLLALLLLVVVAVVVTVGLSSNSKDDPPVVVVVEREVGPTIAPVTSTPTDVPSQPPTLSELESLIQLLAPISGRETLLNPLLPQYQAVQWLAMDDTYDYRPVEENGGENDEDSSSSTSTSFTINDDEDDERRNSLIRDRYVMALLYFSTQGDKWTDSLNFLTNTSVCQWPPVRPDESSEVINGVRCNRRGEVVRIRFVLNNLNGTVPEEIGSRTELEVADFHDNNLVGTLPASFANLERLEILRFSTNEYTGTIPSSYARLSNLEILSLYRNALTGTIPPAIARIPSMDRFLLQSNQLTGTIPEFLIRTGITGIRLRENMLEGTIPDTIYQLPALNTIDLASNFLEGTLGTEIGWLGALTSLSFSSSGLNGTVPTQIGRLQVLGFLSLASNDFSGAIPSEIGSLQALTKLVLSDNKLTGTIPSSLSRLSSIGSIFLEDNLLTGEIPEELAENDWLRNGALSLHNNSFTGSLDLLFCNNTLGAPTFLSSDCDELECSCCTDCCSDITGECSINLNSICTRFDLEFEDCFPCQYWWGTECECLDDGALLTCTDACLSCNAEGTTCLKNVDYGYDFPESGLDHLFRCHMQYVSGRTEKIWYQIDYLVWECSISIDDEACNSCSLARCDDGFESIRIDCSNIEDDAVFDSCNPSLDGGSLLQFMEDPNFYADGGCWPCI